MNPSIARKLDTQEFRYDKEMLVHEDTFSLAGDDLVGLMFGNCLQGSGRAAMPVAPRSNIRARRETS